MTAADTRHRFPKTLLGLVLLAVSVTVSGQGLKPRVIQSAWAGDTLYVIDPATDKIVKEIPGLEVVHGIEVSPDGNRIYTALESDDTVTVVESRSGKVIKKIALAANPNNLAMLPDGRKLYIAINHPPGGVDVVDTGSLAVVKHIALNGLIIHNTFVTPDAKFVVAGSQDNNDRKVCVIDVQTDQMVWLIDYPDKRDVIRPMTFVTNPDGSTKWILLELQELAGFAVVDFATHKEIARIKIPLVDVIGVPSAASIPSHGIAVSPDGRSVWVSSRRDSAVYGFSVPPAASKTPDFKLLGGVPVEGDPWWLVFAPPPNANKLYVANQHSSSVSVIDTTAMKEVTRVRVGPEPKRSTVARLPY